MPTLWPNRRPTMATNKLNGILEMLKSGPVSAADIRTVGFAASSRAAVTSIYRLRNLGHDIITLPPGNRRGETRFRLVRLAGDLRDYELDL